MKLLQSNAKNQPRVHQIIDEYCALDAQIKELTKEKERLREELLSYGEGTHLGKDYTIHIAKSEIVTLSPQKVLSKLRNNAFLTVVTVSTEKARAFLSQPDFEDCISSKKETYRIMVKKHGR